MPANPRALVPRLLRRIDHWYLELEEGRIYVQNVKGKWHTSVISKVEGPVE